MTNKVLFTISAQNIYLSNKSIIDQLQFNSEEEAFEWIKSNRNAIKPKEGEELSLSYIVQVLDVAGKLKGFDVNSLKRYCAAYDCYLSNKSTIDQLRFNSEEEAFEWIKSNRNTIKPKEGEELSLGYIAQVLDVAGKLKGFNVRGLQTNCAAYDCYLSNRSTIDQLQFNSEEEAFEWIKS
ncbi:MAG: hypothetical protein N3G74_02610, partial [Candidatus Micrarchaeota archaeon]|nr:hypothetical protein [Candidatus Micrarchaeota archaeon]